MHALIFCLSRIILVISLSHSKELIIFKMKIYLNNILPTLFI